MNAFDRYAPFVQDYIYRHHWEDLRAVQVAAADVIFNTDENLLLTASTASGKTEAAFFPIITLFSEDPPASVGCIYIGPLKALINDQFDRLTDLCAEADIPVWHWHGDVAASHKQKLLKHPSGILQITPESLEALLLHKHSAIPKLFHDLRFVVIDEVHSLLRGDRGGQTLCLIERLSRLADCNPRRIGLSATMGDPKATGEFLSFGTGRTTIIPQMEAKGAKWRISMEHFYVKGGEAAEPSHDSPAGPALPGGDAAPAIPETEQEDTAADAPLAVLDGATDQAPAHADPGLAYIFEHTRGKKCLVFVNSREECEAVTTTLRSYCEHMHEPDRFLIHHGNLSAAYRQTAEALMKDDSRSLTTVTTSTLELGIDIGRLERAFQIDAPWTVSSFLQRMGRTGRRGNPPEMWFVMREDEPEARAMLPETIPWKLLQGIALVQLYVEERFVEPPRLDRLPYSLLYHQTMSTLASGGEMSPAALADHVLKLHFFHRVSQEDFRLLLRHLVQEDHIEQTPEGGLIVGVKGERVVNSFRFYGVFQENEEYTVRSDSEELGTIVSPPPIGEKIAIAGHVWRVLDIDHKRHLVYCEMIRGKVPAYFGECPGDLHTKVLQRMRGVLDEDRSYPYLMQNAAARLSLARETARYCGVTKKPLINLGGRMWCLVPWVGTYTFYALERFLRIKCGSRLGIRAFDSARPFYMQFTMQADEETFYQVAAEEAAKPIDPMTLLFPKELPVFDKYDEYLPDELVKKGFACGVLDLDGMRSTVQSWGNTLSTTPSHRGQLRPKN